MEENVVYKFLVLLCLVKQVTGQPVIADQPIVGNVKEATFAQVAIADIKCTDPGGGKVAVSIETVTSTPTAGHCQRCFQAFNFATGLPEQWKIYFIPGNSPLSYLSASRYDIMVACRDGNGGTTNTVIGINVIPNAPPFFNPVYINKDIPNSGTKTAGDSIDFFTALDPDGDSLFYTMNTSITTDIFQINAATGEVTLRKALGALCRSNLVLYIEARDNFNAQVAKLSANLHFKLMNYPSIITNLNRVVTVKENMVPDSIPIERTDTQELAFTCDLTVQPPSMTSKINYDNTGPKILLSLLNYEVDKNANITVQCTDGLCNAVPKWVYLQILDVNDNPRLDPPTQTISVPEGYISVLPNYILTDEDGSDPPVYYFVNAVPAGFFIDKVTGRIRTNIDYRVDMNNQVDLTLTIAANDTKGPQPTNPVTVLLSIYDVNDNRPIITKTSYEYLLEDCTPPGVLDTLVATDADGGINSEIEFETKISGSLSVTSTGQISLRAAPVAGGFDNVEVYAYDKGLNPGVLKSAAPAVITLIGIPCATTPFTGATTGLTTESTTMSTEPPEPTLPPNQRKNNPEDLIWISMACVLGLAIVALFIFIIYRCNVAARNKRRDMSRKDGPPRKSSKAYVNPDHIKTRSASIVEATPVNKKQEQKDYFKNDIKDNYKETYKTKTLTSAV
ncbi:protein dachsous [Patella vulgata]|uniref:protein dachsous n=1 Tax=Patella vulgata TaxID=6465 RepID=UPI0021805312|nr:protein dachsous [Patella vulgata]